MQYIIRYDVKPQQAEAFRAWLSKNREAFGDHAPTGWSYVGTWFTVQGFGSYQAETRWELDDYASLGSGFGDEENQRLLAEWFDFVAEGRPNETYLMKSADDVSILKGT